MKVSFIFIVILGLFVLSGCSTNENAPLEPDPAGEPIKLTVTYDQVYYLKLSDKSVVDITDPLLEKEWDITISNLTTVQLNGGSTAPGTVFASKIEGIAFNSLESAPEVTYMTDDQNGGYIGDNWYTYNITTHVVTPLDHFYTILASDGEFYKFKISDVAFPSRESGELTINIEKISSPSLYETQSTVGRSLITEITLSTLGPVYFNLKEAKMVEISDEMTSQDWDLRTSYLTVNLNGGTSGPGSCSAVMFEDANFDSLLDIPSEGYTSDDSTTSSLAIGDSWWSYDPVTHTLSALPNIYVIKTSEGHYAKLEFIAKNFPSQSEGVAIVRLHYTENASTF